MKRYIYVACLLMISLRAPAQTLSDSTGKADTLNAKLGTKALDTGVHFPAISDKLLVLGLVLFVVAGLGMILNEKRKQADREAGLHR
jgi:hypothetical protein